MGTVRSVVGVLPTSLHGTGTGLLDAGSLLVAGLRPGARDRVLGRALDRESARLGHRHAAVDRRAAGFLAARAVLGPVGGLTVLVGLAAGLGYVGWSATLSVTGEIDAQETAAGVGLGLAALLVSWQLAVVLTAADRWLARRLLDPDPQEALQRRVDELALSRAAVVEVVDGERRRIERDLHDGAQQRLVALGMLLGRARRTEDDAHARELLVQAHEETAAVLGELRELVWRVYPAALDQDGLVAAVQALAERSPLPVTVHARVDREPPAPIGRAAYFVVSEALTNVSKHAGADTAVVHLVRQGGALVVQVVDAGVGGADPAGSGLGGLGRRVAALDGRLTVSSPPGGPTEVIAELPCG